MKTLASSQQTLYNPNGVFIISNWSIIQTTVIVILPHNVHHLYFTVGGNYIYTVKGSHLHFSAHLKRKWTELRVK